MMNLFATQAEHVHNTIYSDRLTGRYRYHGLW